MDTPHFTETKDRVPTFNRLCDDCKAKFPSAAAWTWTEASFQNIEDGVILRRSNIRQLIDSVEAGCHMCNVLLEAITPSERNVAGMGGGSFEERRYQLQAKPEIHGWTLRIVLELPGLSKLGFPFDDIKKDLLLMALHQVPKKDGTRRPVWSLCTHRAGTPSRMDVIQTESTYNISPITIEQVKTWLETCEREHYGCKQQKAIPDSETGPPFRLIDIGSITNANVHLIQSSEINGELKYITLSHRWTDDTKKAQLIKSKESAFSSSMPLRDWPLLFQDTVSIARQLHIQYVWIDSLCIIQNSSEDKAIQVQLMDKIYANGVLNLAAVEAPARSSGLGAYRNPLKLAPCILSRRVSTSDTSLQYFLCWRPDDFIINVDKSPLYRRGWTFQERLLSKRTLHLGHQLYWECASLRASEAFPIGTDYPDHFVDKFAQDLKIQLQSNTEAQHKDDAAVELHKLWCAIVRFYSDTELSFACDRLVALRGIVNSLIIRYGLSNDDYAAGIWKPCLPEQLLWGRDEETFPKDENKEVFNYAPSWSWASCEGRTRFKQINLRAGGCRASLIKVTSFEVPEGSASKVQTASMILLGRLISCSFKPGMWEIVRCQRNFTIDGCSGQSNIIQAGVIDFELDRPIPSNIIRVVLLPICIDLLSGIIEGLLLGLLEQDEGHMAVYVRLGLFFCRDDVLFDRGFFSQVNENDLEAKLERLLTLAQPTKLV
jgi:hypothetical protein